MCQNANKTAYGLLTAIEPTIKSILQLTGQANTQAGLAVIAAYDSALTALQNWTSGTTAQNILELIGALQAAMNAVFTAVPVSPQLQSLINIILAGVEAVIGVINANSPAPVAALEAAGDATAEEVQAHHQVEVAVATESKVQALVPGFKRSIWHSAASQYKKTWNDAITANGFDPSLKVA